jgi:hypothetical protein
MEITGGERVIIEEIIGGRYDSLVEILNGNPNIPNKAQLLKDIKTLEPLVKKLRNIHE